MILTHEHSVASDSMSKAAMIKHPCVWTDRADSQGYLLRVDTCHARTVRHWAAGHFGQNCAFRSLINGGIAGLSAPTTSAL